MLKVLFTQNSETEALFCGASPGSEPKLFFNYNLLSLGFEPIQNGFQNDFTLMTAEADGSVVLVEL